MTITYELGPSLYINLTNRCTNNCSFCVRNSRDSVNGTDALWLPGQEPSLDEIKKDFKKRDLSKYHEVVFCGFGEPFLRYEELLSAAQWLKSEYNPQIRVNTNGHANLIAGHDITPRLEGIIDALSISLNAPSSKKYQELCNSIYDDAFDQLLDFTKKAKKYVKDITLTVVDAISAEDIASCEKIANVCGVSFRVRELM